MNAQRFCRSWAVITALSLGAIGCGPPESDSDLVPVTGTVTLDGEPLAGATVSYDVARGTAGQGGTGTTDAEGKYKISHFRAGEGINPGEYTVSISKLVLSDGSPIPPDAESIFNLDTKDLVPPKYNVATTLTTTVMPNSEPIDFELKSK